MKVIIVALSLVGMAYAGGYGLDTLSSVDLGKMSLELSGYGNDGGYGKGYGGGYGGDDGSYLHDDSGSYREDYSGSYLGDDSGSYKGGYGGDDNDNKGSRIILIKSSGRDDRRSYGRSYGDDLDSGSDIRHGNYDPMPQQRVKYVSVPVPVKKPYPVPVDKPYTVKIDKPYPVKVERIEKKPYVAKVVRPVIEKTIHVRTSKHTSYSSH